MSVKEILRDNRKGRLRWISHEILESRSLRHGFTLRYGGVSRGSFASLNFTSRQGDLPARVNENWRRLETAAGLPARRWALVSQVHGADVVVAAPGGAACHHRRACPPADALVSRGDGSVLGILTADCLPLILASPDGRTAALAHAGWRGTLLGIAVRTVQTIAAAAGVKPAEMLALLGPGIGSCCYHVGEEVTAAFRDAWGPRFTAAISSRAGETSLDLREANRRQLTAAGLLPGNIGSVGLCTSCRSDLFFSHRRDGERSGRMLAFAAPQEKGEDQR